MSVLLEGNMLVLLFINNTFNVQLLRKKIPLLRMEQLVQLEWRDEF